jgi:hypothetical protein
MILRLGPSRADPLRQHCTATAALPASNSCILLLSQNRYMVLCLRPSWASPLRLVRTAALPNPSWALLSLPTATAAAFYGSFCPRASAEFARPVADVFAVHFFEGFRKIVAV